MSTKTSLLKSIKELGAPAPPSDLLKDELVEYESTAYKMWKKGDKFDTPIKGRQKALTYTPVEPDRSIHWLDHFDKYGWAVVPVPDLDVNAAVESFYDWLEECSPEFDREDKSTWKNVPYNYHGIFKQGVGHEEFVWNIREKTYPLFKEFWGKKDLLTSFDGACFLPEKRDSGWLHCDQSRGVKHIECVQGFVNLLDNGPEDGGLFLAEGSDLKYRKYLRTHPLTGYGKFQFKVNPNDPVLSECHQIKVCSRAGELVIWSGYIFHCNVAPRNKNSLRMCVYVSMEPRVDCPKKLLKKRIKAFEEGRMTGHWCYGRCFHVNPAKAFDHGTNTPQPPPLKVVKLNKLRRKLIGYE